jgi:hypothetical protein
MTALVTLLMISLVVLPSSSIMTHQAIFGVMPPLQDGFPVEGDFATSFVEKYLAARIAKNGNREEIVDQAGELTS